MNAPAIEAEIPNLTITDHYPPGITIDRQALNILEATGQGCRVLQHDIGGAGAVGDDIANQCAVTHPQVGFGALSHFHQDAIAGGQR
ncbi:hypothetical protein D3C84_1160770 [compost metagenome]